VDAAPSSRCRPASTCLAPDGSDFRRTATATRSTTTGSRITAPRQAKAIPPLPTSTAPSGPSCPCGEVLRQASRVFEYEPFAQSFQIEPGQRELKLPLERVADSAKSSWITADTPRPFQTRQHARPGGAAEGLNVTPLPPVGRPFHQRGDITGAQPAPAATTASPGREAENRTPSLGHISYAWECRGDPVFPLQPSARPGVFRLSYARAISPMGRQCKRKVGLVVVPHFLPVPALRDHRRDRAGASGRRSISGFLDRPWDSSRFPRAVTGCSAAAYRVAVVGD